MLEWQGKTFFDSEALLDRLTDGVKVTGREIVFVVGAPLTAPTEEGGLGVANVDGVVELIREHFIPSPGQLEKFDQAIKDAENPYQAAFTFLQGRRSQDVANQIVRDAVFKSRIGDLPKQTSFSDSSFSELEKDIENWHLSPGVEALGEISTSGSEYFGKAIITSNFDPLIQVSIKKNGGNPWRTALHGDGSLTQSNADGCQIIHIHGYWHGSDTLHTGTQLLQKRPTLKSSLLRFLQNKTVVVIGYGGWEDVFTSMLQGALDDQELYPELLWGFYESSPSLNPYLSKALASGINRGRVTMYAGIDCHIILPAVAKYWSKPPSQSSSEMPPNSEESAYFKRKPILKRQLRRLEHDRPPHVEYWVGRDDELRALEGSNAKVIALHGIGGQGKSVLAAKFIQLVDNGDSEYKYWDWRDCKEEGDRIRTQLISIIERLSEKDLDASTLQASDDTDLVEIFLELCQDLKMVFVFDNVDHYVDLENQNFVGLLDRLVREYAISDSPGRILITCRPKINYTLPSVIDIPMSGFTIEEAQKIFQLRASSIELNLSEIQKCHELTNGHPFWLDLMAAQVNKVSGKSLKQLISDIEFGRQDSPDVLSSIWSSLLDREKTLLRTMAENVRPETEEGLVNFVSNQLNFKNFKKAQKSLISLNLIVVKPENNAPDLFDLHPLVRQFIKRNFDKSERETYVNSVLSYYTFIIKGIRSMLNVYMPIGMLERWSQKAEIEIEAGMFSEAFSTLSDAKSALIGSGHVEEYIRVSKRLFSSIDWQIGYSKYKEFDGVLVALIKCLTHLGEYEDADDLLDKFEQTIPQKTARYILFCDTKCDSLWLRKSYDRAKEWGEKGVKLKQSTNVDTEHDCEHTLALVRRDSGRPNEAIEYFLKNNDLEKLLDPNDITAHDQGTTLGNVGRCLQKMGRPDDALICYKKSAKALEGETGSTRMDNQAYAREWIGEVLLELEQFELAYCFFITSDDLLSKFTPTRSKLVRKKMDSILRDNPDINVTRVRAKRVVSNWLK